MGRLFIIHYHLNPGGVTRIIESQVQALKEDGYPDEIIVLTGDCANQDFFKNLGISILIHAPLNYLFADSDFKREYNSLETYFDKLIQPGDILHVHNLNLGKNPVLTLVLQRFAEKGFTLINHAHDFAEDRPANMELVQKVFLSFGREKPEKVFYADLPNFIHACLNTPDLKRIREYGVPENRSFLLPNPVVFNSAAPNSKPNKQKICETLGIDSSKKLITYPVRVIRRKNIGEYVLLCMLFKEEANWLVTQPPKNPVEIEPYEKWKRLCAELKIPLVFEAGTQVDFEELIRSSDFCFTTSIQEGFGMVYMEPWLMGTAVIGRNLKNITPDLEQSGMQFPLLYNTLQVPQGSELSDFGSLDMDEQMNFIRLLSAKAEIGEELYRLNPFLNNLLNSIAEPLIEKNKSTIISEFSLNNYARQLKRIYQEFAG